MLLFKSDVIVCMRILFIVYCAELLSCLQSKKRECCLSKISTALKTKLQTCWVLWWNNDSHFTIRVSAHPDVYPCGNAPNADVSISVSVIWLYWFKQLISGNGYFVCLACDQIFPMHMVWRWTGFHVIYSGPAMTAIRNRSTWPDWMAPSKTLLFRAWTSPTASCCILYWGERTRATNTCDIYTRNPALVFYFLKAEKKMQNRMQPHALLFSHVLLGDIMT